jgi:hypothetical protein
MRARNIFLLCFLLSAAVPLVFSAHGDIRGTTLLPAPNQEVAPLNYGRPAGLNYSVTLSQNVTNGQTLTRSQSYAWDPFSTWVVTITVPTLLAVSVASVSWGLRARKPVRLVLAIASLLDLAAFFTILLALGPGSQQVIPFLRIWARASFDQSIILATALVVCLVGLAAAVQRSRKLSGVGGGDFSFEVFQKRNTPRGFYSYDLPRVGFELRNLSPITARVWMSVHLGERTLGMVQDQHGYYSGEMTLERPQPSVFWGNFTVPSECANSQENLRLQARVDAADNRKRVRTLVRCFTYNRANDSWFLEPTSWENLLKRAKEKGYKL